MNKLSKTKKNKISLDQYLIDNELVENEKIAVARILAGEVKVDGVLAQSAKQLILPDAIVEIKALAKYVSRAGDKLFYAIEHFNLEKNFENKIILDLGSSTGGFSDCTLQLGAKHIFCVDVGTNQLAWKLRKDLRITVLEKQDARTLTPNLLHNLAIDWVTMDLSFISSKLVLQNLQNIFSLFTIETKFLVLLKPQFELPSSHIPEGGVVKDAEVLEKCVMDFKSFLEESTNFKYIDHQSSKVKGRQGNQEYFFYFSFVEYK